MNFLNAKKVEMLRYTQEGVTSRQLYSDTDNEQMTYFGFDKTGHVLREELNIIFDPKKQNPRKISLNANQYIKEYLEMEISLFKRGAAEPYRVMIMDPLRTFVEFEPNTSKMVIACDKDKCEGKIAKVKFIINYIEY